MKDPSLFAFMRESMVRRKAGFSRLRRVLPYILSNFRCNGPRVVDIELSNRCNLRCRMCWFHGEKGIGDRYAGCELTTNEVFGIVDQLARGRPRVYIGGSEPFIREDFLMILSHIKRRDLSVSFTTNGTLLDAAKIETLIALGVDAVNFSIDGHETLHDEARGQGVFKNVTHSVRLLSEYKKREKRRNPVIAVNITLTRALMGHVKETLKSIRDATNDGADFYRLHHLWYVTEDELSGHQSTIRQKLGCEAPGAASHVLPRSRILDSTGLAAELVCVRNWPKIGMFPNLQYTDIISYYSERPTLRQRCVAPFFGAVIKPNGDVKFCPDEWIDDYLLGNVRAAGFYDIWNNEKARTFRAVLWRAKHFAGCNRCSWMYADG